MSLIFWKKWLTSINPSSGRLVREDGERINVADIFSDAQDVSKALTTMDLEHRRIHDGLAWSVSIDCGSIDSLAKKYILFKNTTEYMHFRSYTFEAIDGPFLVKLFENPTITADGTLQVEKNRKTMASDDSSLEVYLSPTVTSNGTLLEYDILGGSFKSGGSVSGTFQEWILDLNTSYLLELHNVGNQISTNNVVNAFWYRGQPL